MNELFGLSMTYIMIALLVILAIAFSTIAWVILRDRVMFFIGVRNIPRRRAQTVLIIIGLMLSTLIISTAFSIGDTVDYSITNQTYDRLHSVDQTVAAQAEGSTDDPFEASSVVSARPIPNGQAADYVDRFKQIDGVEGAVAVVIAPVPVSNERAGQTEPVVLLAGVDKTQMHGFESDIESLAGEQLSLSDLARNEVYLNKDAADKLDAQKGDTLKIFVAGKPTQLTVREIVKTRVLTGAALGVTLGMVMDRQSAQSILDRSDVDFIAVTNDGGVRDSLADTDRITDEMNAMLKGTQWHASDTKQKLVDAASQAASFLTTFFVVLGLFSIAAGMLLIFLIFVMLAAERKPEMGMIRAVGTKRRHLVEMFMSEGMAYNVGAAAVGCAFGVLVSMVMVRVLAALFASLDLNIVFHVSPRSLIVSYSLGVVLTYITVTFASWRVGNLNIVSAIRDTPEPQPERMRPQAIRGFRSLLSFVRWLTVKPRGWKQWLISVGMLVLVPLEIALVQVLFLAAAAIYGTSSVASVIAVLLGIAGGAAVLLALGTLLAAFNRIFQLGAMGIAIGAILIVVGLLWGKTAPFSAGVSFVILGVAATLTMVGVRPRPVFTTAGLVLLAFWLLGAGGRIPPHLDGGIEMFFLSGVIMVLASTFVLVYNADLLLAVLTRVGSSLFSQLVPSIRTAVAYPLANKFRTGMTIAMISLVMFALVMISTMNENFNRIFLSKDAEGGYQVVVEENPSNHIEDLVGALNAAGADTSGIAAVDNVDRANRRVSQIRNKPVPGDDPEYSSYSMLGPSDGFLSGNGVKLQARAEGYADDRAVWAALGESPNLAVIDEFAIGGGGFGGGDFTLDGVEDKDKTFKPITVQIRDGSSPNTVRDVQVVGIIATKASALYQGLWLSPQTFHSLFVRPESTAHLVKLNPGVDATEQARMIEKTLLAQGVQADSLRKIIDDAQAQQRGFLYLIQGFMGIGLFVGIAAVGVIAFRTVVERRQQIGMLRAIGYTRRAVAISFIMESSFIALLGILSGIALAILLANQLLTSPDFASNQIESFYIPWVQIIAIASFAFIASLLMTIVPSRQASSIPIAEALRYE